MMINLQGTPASSAAARRLVDCASGVVLSAVPCSRSMGGSSREMFLIGEPESQSFGASGWVCANIGRLS